MIIHIMLMEVNLEREEAIPAIPPHMDQEMALALCKKAIEHRMEAMKAKMPKPIIKEIPATTKSNTDCTLNPMNSIMFPLLWSRKM
ncbi:hypothetical protein Patl1_16597 [Pistacia atlantica]|uniref:Uncharacterized protein n=1 Tax=Pistacia atlantica TaxID=434234 RepID=A0ACC1B5K3_9ROSI|nr:hypothetical protein Patl1_16597 [Pistacia atlantica]